MNFTVQGLKEFQPKAFRDIEKRLRELRSFGPKTFAILADERGGYVQVAGGSMTCVVERRLAGTTKQERAYLAQSRVPFEGCHEFRFGGGKLDVEPEEFLSIDQVLRVFRAFYQMAPWPEDIGWRALEAISE